MDPMKGDFGLLCQRIRDLVCPQCRARSGGRKCQVPECSLLNELAILVDMDRSQASDWRVRETLGTLNRDWQRNITVSQLAGAVGLSVSRLQHLFRAHLGLTISEYLAERRLRQAAGLLLRTDLHVSEICYYVGYNSLSHFVRLFRRRYGISPTCFRKEHL